MRERLKDDLLQSLLAISIFPYYVLINVGVRGHPALGLIAFTLLVFVCYIPRFLNPTGAIPLTVLYFSFTTIVFFVFIGWAVVEDFRYRKEMRERRERQQKKVNC